MAQQHRSPHNHQQHHSVIDLTTPDEEAKRRIVAHAQKHLAEQHQQHQQHQQAPVTIELDDDDDEDQPENKGAGDHDMKRQRTQRGVQEDAAGQEQPNGSASGGGAFANAPLYPMRDVLKAAHQERMRRLHQDPPHQAVAQAGMTTANDEGDVDMAAPTPAKTAPSSAAAVAVGAGGTASKGASTGVKRPRLFGMDGGNAGGGSGGGGGGAANAPGMQPWAPSQSLPARPGGPATIKVLTYNIWFEEGVALEERMQGLADVVLSLEPDVLMFQEVTHNMIRLWFTQHEWLAESYTFSRPPTGSPYFTMLAFRKQTMQPLPSSPAQGALLADPTAHARLIQRWPLDNSAMGRDVLAVPLRPSQRPDAPALLVATSHLESPLGFTADKNMAAKREEQVAAALPWLAQLAAAVRQQQQQEQQGRRLDGQQAQRRRRAAEAVDVLWGGDFNWNRSNREPVLPDEWEDVWPSHPEARAPGEALQGFTYDTKRNQTLHGSKLPPGRIDRFFARLAGWQVESMQLVGTEPLPNVSALHRNQRVPVHISDHFGILLKLRWDGV